MYRKLGEGALGERGRHLRERGEFVGGEEEGGGVGSGIGARRRRVGGDGIRA